MPRSLYSVSRFAVRLVDMLSRTERIDGLHLKVSRTEKELYEEFLGTEEAEILAEIQHYFAQAKQKGGGIRFEQKTLWAKIENRVDIGSQALVPTGISTENYFDEQRKQSCIGRET